MRNKQAQDGGAYISQRICVPLAWATGQSFEQTFPVQVRPATTLLLSREKMRVRSPHYIGG